MGVTEMRALVFRYLGLSTPGGIWRVIAILFALMNVKNLPFVWHIRLFSGLLTHLLARHPPFHPTTTGPRALFQPLITRTRPPLFEIDYNIHKSNSTYFSDADISRTQLVSALCLRGIEKFRRVHGKGAKFMLGGVSCVFRREIKPYKRYEMWSRVLCWDRKWLYIVTHFVKDGVKPTGYTLQPWKTAKKGKKSPKEDTPSVANGHASSSSSPTSTTMNDASGSAASPAQPHPFIFASLVSKYVFKANRLTIPPDQILEGSGLLPPKPPSTTLHPPTPPTTNDSTSPTPLGGTRTPAEGGMSIEGSAAAVTTASMLEKFTSHEAIDASLRPFTDPGEGVAEDMKDTWSWERVEEERKKGLWIAELMNGMDGLHHEFSGETKPALGVFRDFLG
ncbi:MAG: hypothetical protein M1827_002194 [Pycnora praestabilis]|nr:MAG: hypothetical protein M1827_002194 [Pycnora praestabilis]